MTDEVTLVNGSGVVFDGTMGAPGASASDVLTADGEGGTSWAAGGGSQPNVTDGTTTIDAPALIEISGATLTGDSTEAVFTIGSGVTGSEYIAGNNVTVTNGDTADLTWDTKSEGDDLVDISTPSAPTIVATGRYAVTVIVQVGANMTAGGSYNASLGTNPDATQTAPGAVTANLAPTVSLTMVASFTAGDALEVNVANNDGVQDLPFLLALAHVERLG